MCFRVSYLTSWYISQLVAATVKYHRWCNSWFWRLPSPSSWYQHDWMRSCFLVQCWTCFTVSSHDDSDSKGFPCNTGDRVWPLGQEDPLKKGMATYSRIPAWRIPWTKPGGLQSMSLKTSHGTEWLTLSDGGRSQGILGHLSYKTIHVIHEDFSV